jgi:hypothetical protein
MRGSGSAQTLSRRVLRHEAARARVGYLEGVNQPSPAPRDDNGIDLTLIDAFLAMTPTERLRRNEEASRTVLALQKAYEEAVDEGASRPR